MATATRSRAAGKRTARPRRDTRARAVATAPLRGTPLERVAPSGAEAALARAQYVPAVALRFAYFLSQGVANSRLVQGSNLDVAAIAQTVAKVVLGDGSPSDIKQPVTTTDMRGQPLEAEEAVRMSQFWEENIGAIVGLFRKELGHVEAGDYALPYDLSPFAPQAADQWNPFAVFQKAQMYMEDQEVVLARRMAKDGQEVQRNTIAAVDEGRYPAYYRQNFHFQTDGWFSTKSAQLYDYQVETLFLGSSDAMRRQALPYFSRWMAGRSFGEPTKVLDVACGTGRFASFLLQNFPELELTATDLSPYYLQEARNRLSQFSSSVKYVEANAEELPLEDESFDAVTNVYLFHELPRAARSNCVKEWARVLKPGGKVFFVDSAQKGDGEVSGMKLANDVALDGFPRFNHEPYYNDYVQQDLKEMFAEHGFSCDAVEIAWVSKVMCFTKTGITIEKPAAATVVEDPAEEAAPAEDATPAETEAAA